MIEYLACPYTHADEHQQYRRYQDVTNIAAQLMREGRIIYSPITSMHYLARRFKQGEYNWLKHDLEILAKCDRMIVLMLDGWENSEGLKTEIEFAKKHYIHIEYMEPPRGQDNQNS